MDKPFGKSSKVCENTVNEMMVTLVTQAGPMVALVLFFVWADSKRDEKNRLERDELHKYVRNTLHDLIRENQQLISALRDKDDSE